MQAVVTQRAKEQSHAWAASALPPVCGNDGCSLGAAPCGAMQLQQLPSYMRDRTLGPRGARTMYDSLTSASMNVNNRHSQRSEVERQADMTNPNGIQATALSVDAATTTASVKTAAASYRLVGIICPSSTIFSLLGKASLHSIFGLREAISSWMTGLSARITICWMCRLMQSQWRGAMRWVH